MRVLDSGIALSLLVVTLPVLLAVAVVIKLDSPGPALYRCRRAGLAGSDFMLKFRKMFDGASGVRAHGSRGRAVHADRPCPRATKLDEIPQLWNVLKGEMSLVGPRPGGPRLRAS